MKEKERWETGDNAREKNVVVQNNAKLSSYFVCEDNANGIHSGIKRAASDVMTFELLRGERGERETAVETNGRERGRKRGREGKEKGVRSLPHPTCSLRHHFSTMTFATLQIV